MDIALAEHLISAATALTAKLAMLIIGYKVTKLGHDLLVKGVTGEFKFSGSYNGAKGDLISASPGLLFLLLGVVVLAVAITKSVPFNTTVEQQAGGAPVAGAAGGSQGSEHAHLP